MVVIQVPYTLDFRAMRRGMPRKLISTAEPAFARCHLDPHVLHTAAVFAILTRLHEGDERAPRLSPSECASSRRGIDGVSRTDADRLRGTAPPTRRSAAVSPAS